VEITLNEGAAGDLSLSVGIASQRHGDGRGLESINEEVRFLLKLMGDSGEVVRARLRKSRQLKLAVRNGIGKAFNDKETDELRSEARKSKSPHIYPVFMLARNAALRDNEIKTLTGEQIDLKTRFLRVGRAKSEEGEGRTIPLNSELYEALPEYRSWYEKRFGAINDEWYLFPFGRSMRADPTRHVTTLKTAWKTIRRKPR